MDPALKPLLQTALTSYKTGLSMPPIAPSCNVDSLLQSTLLSVLRTRLTPFDFTVVCRIIPLCGKAVMEAKRGHLLEAEQSMEDVKAFAEGAPLVMEARAVHATFALAAEAYLKYAAGQWETAEQLCFRALAAEVTLEHEYGYSGLHVRRLHLVENIARVVLRAGRAKDAATLHGGILSYINGHCESLDIGGPWFRSALLRQPEELIRTKCDQVAAQVADILAAAQPGDVEVLYDIVTAKGQRNVRHGRYPRIDQWFRMTGAYIHGDMWTFLRDAVTFLGQGRQESPALWYSTVANVVTCARNMDMAPSVEMIALEADRWPDIPLAIKATVKATARELQ
jgi:hypothetical protein